MLRQPKADIASDDFADDADSGDAMEYFSSTRDWLASRKKTWALQRAKKQRGQFSGIRVTDEADGVDDISAITSDEDDDDVDDNDDDDDVSAITSDEDEDDDDDDDDDTAEPPCTPPPRRGVDAKRVAQIPESEEDQAQNNYRTQPLVNYLDHAAHSSKGMAALPTSEVNAVRAENEILKQRIAELERKELERAASRHNHSQIAAISDGGLGESSVNFDDDEPRLLFLLPSDFFEASGARSRIYSLLGFRVEFEFKLGMLWLYHGVEGCCQCNVAQCT